MKFLVENLKIHQRNEVKKLKNESGSSLVLVLLITVIFTIIGLSLMTQVLTENRLSILSEEEMQARNLAESGLVYFEKDLKRELKNCNTFDDVKDFITNKYSSGQEVISDENTSEKAIIERAETTEEDTIKVYSKGIVNSVETTLIDEYELIPSVDIDEWTEELANFQSGGVAVDFSKFNVASVSLGPLLNLDLINVKGSDSRYYTVPDDDVVNVNLIGPILDISIGDGERFNTMEELPVIASRSGIIAKLNIIEGSNDRAVVRVRLLNYKDVNDTNVLVNGYFQSFVLLGLPIGAGYRDIDFQRFAVLGNANLQQDKEGDIFRKDDDERRYFSFRDGLFVNRSLVFGDEQNEKGNIGLIGDMVAMNNFVITNVDLQIGKANDSKYQINTPEDGVLNVYVHGDVLIDDSCIHLQDSDYDFRIFTKGKITFKNNPDCSTYPGFYYAEEGIHFETKGHDMTIDGSVIGERTVDNEDKLTITGTERNITEENVDFELRLLERKIE